MFVLAGLHKVLVTADHNDAPDLAKIEKKGPEGPKATG
jgi:hypothetical protein